MPAVLNYPGVYIEEVPSGVRTIVGVATSVTAFLGRAVFGPVNQPVTIFSFADFERQFGGLGIDYPMSYAVADFYRNGGSQAIIVRLFTLPNNATGIGRVTVNGLKLDAASPGSWSKGLSATTTANAITEDVAKRFKLPKAELFNLTVTRTVDNQVINLERFRNLSVKPESGAQRVDRVLQQSSQLVRVALKDDKKTPDLPTAIPLPAGGGAGGAGGGAGGAGGGAG